jgi:NAD(P)-dependent dehydrogenase (short-subunit alcohol dehydrogenase family)
MASVAGLVGVSWDGAYSASKFAVEGFCLAMREELKPHGIEVCTINPGAYGIYNPYTGRGAIAGLLPHGPHNVRDVLATHILKQTGSCEQASYAIQDTPDMVAKHYGRFLPQDKAELAARILNQVWEAA